MADQDDDRKPSRKEEEEDQVTAAYENISKKLEHLRKGKEVEDEDTDKEETAFEDEDPLDKEDEDPLDQEDEVPDEEKDAEDAVNEDIEKPIAPLPGTDTDEETFDSPKADDSEEIEDFESPKETFRPREEIGRPEPTHAVEQPEDMDDLVEEKPPMPTPSRFNDDLSGDFDIPNLRPTSSHFEAGMSSDMSSKPAYSELPYSKRVSSDSDPSSFFNRHQAQSSSRKANKWSLLILILIGIGVIGFTVYLLKNGLPGSSSSTTASPSPAASVESTPTPSPSPVFDRSKFKVRVLNGTTKAGLAASVSAKLKDLGYQLDKTGNAPKQDFKTTQIKVKSSATGLSDQLISDLSSDYKDASSAGELKDSDAADAEVVIGGK